MDQSHYNELLNEVRNDIEVAQRAIADAEKTIADLGKLEDYLLLKVKGSGASSRSDNSKPPAGRSSRVSKPSREVEADAGDSSARGMQTVEFGPDGFPAT